MKKNSDTSKANEVNNYDYNYWYERHKDFLIEQFDNISNELNKELKEDYKYYKIEFKFFCYLYWKTMLNKKEGESYITYMILDGIFDLSYKIDDFVVEYASKIIEIDKEDQNSLLNIVNKKENYRLFYMIYASMLGVENYYYDKMYKSISESEFYKELSEIHKSELNDLLSKLRKTNLKSSFYYEDYERIKLEQDFKNDEKDYIYNAFKYDKFDTWEFAFIILAIRHKTNPHFLSLFTDGKDKLDVSDINSLKNFAQKFHSNYNIWNYRKK